MAPDRGRDWPARSGARDRPHRPDGLESAGRPAPGIRLSAPASVTSRYRFGDVLIDLDSREIHRDGDRVEVEAKVFDLIALLLDNRGRAVDKRELNAALWGDRPVTDAALSQQLRKARRALGDDGNAQRIIRTVHGRGLLWVAEVVEARPDATTNGALDDGAVTSPPAPAPAPSSRGLAGRAFALAAAGLLLVLAIAAWWPRDAADPPAPAVPRIAVLPLDDQSGEAALGWTRSGLMGLMSGLLEQGGRVDVVAARNVQAVDAAAAVPDPAQARRLRHSLGATHLVATRLRRVGPVYEFDLHLLVPGGTGRDAILHGDAPAPLAVEAVQRVRQWLSLDNPRAVAGRAGSPLLANPFLAQAHARGLDAQLRGDHAAARRYFEICLDQDPGLAWPRLGLAIAQGETGEFDASARNATQVAAAARELGDDELLVAALRQLGSIAFRRGDLDGAAVHVDAALEDLSPARPLALTELLVARASIDDERGDFSRSRAGFERALSLARETGNRRGEALVLVNLASLENGAGDAAAAGRLLRSGLEAAREAGDGSLEAVTLVNLAATEANLGHLPDAVTLFRQAHAGARRRGDIRTEALAATQLIRALAPFGRDAEIASLASRVSALAGETGNGYWQAELEWALAEAAAKRADTSASLAHLERARELYAEAGMTRNLAPVLAQIVEAATDAGDAARAHGAADAFRTIAAADPAAWNAWLPLLDAQLRKADGDPAGALAALAAHLDRVPGAQGPAAFASLFQLGRWQVAAGQTDDLLLREDWRPWLRSHPGAISLRISALRAAGRGDEADTEQARLGHLLDAADAASPPDPALPEP